MPSNTSDIPTEFRYYGGSRFDTDNLKEEQWLPYGDDFFVLPRIELVCSKEPDWTESEISTERSGPRHMSAPCYWLAVNCCVLGSQLAENGWSSEISAALIAAENIRQASSRREIPAKLPPIVEKIESLSPDEWASAYESISAKIQAGTLARMELERKTSADFATEVEALDLLFLLKQRDAGRFCLQLDAETALLDCSVGPVYRVSGGSIETRVIAATRPRGCTAEEDVAQADGFFLDGGEDSAAAAAALERASELLAAFGGDVRVSDPFVVTSRHAQQLCRAVRARAPGPSPKNAWPAATALGAAATQARRRRRRRCARRRVSTAGSSGAASGSSRRTRAPSCARPALSSAARSRATCTRPSWSRPAGRRWTRGRQQGTGSGPGRYCRRRGRVRRGWRACPT